MRLMFNWFPHARATAPLIQVPFAADPLCLRPFTMADAPAFTIWTRNLLSVQHMSAFLLTYPQPFAPRHARARIRQTHVWHRQGRGWSLAIDWQGQLVGQAQIICLRPHFRLGEIAYWIAPPFQRRGLATAAMQALIEAARDHWPLERLEATVVRENQASIRLLNHLGFTYRDLERIPYRVQGSWRRKRAEVLVFSKCLYSS